MNALKRYLKDTRFAGIATVRCSFTVEETRGLIEWLHVWHRDLADYRNILRADATRLNRKPDRDTSKITRFTRKYTIDAVRMYTRHTTFMIRRVQSLGDQLKRDIYTRLGNVKDDDALDISIQWTDNFVVSNIWKASK